MQWKRIPKEQAIQPAGTYKDWKELLAKEGFHQCVYCAIPEAAMGGIRIFHVEHFRPKSEFPGKENDFLNLFYACPICNTFKGADWPTDPDNHDVVCYVDPSKYDLSELFEVNNVNGVINGKVVASRYMVEKLYLNRPQLTLARRQATLEFFLKMLIEVCHERYSELMVRLRDSVQDEQKPDRENVKKACDLIDRYINIKNRISLMYLQLGQLSPYDAQDIKRQ